MALFNSRLTNARVEPVASSAGSVPLKPLRATVTFDATWAPYIQGTLVCSRQSAAQATATDPRQALCTKFTMSHEELGGANHVDLNMVAWLRSRSTDYTADETTLSFASLEAIMQDYVDFTGQQYGAGTTDTDSTNDARSRIDLFNNGTLQIDNSNGPGNFAIALADSGWDVGSTIWDVVNTIESPKAIWLHGDESGQVLHRHYTGYSANTAPYSLNRNRVLSVVDLVDRDDPNFANGVFINYTYNKGANTTTDYGVAGSPGVIKSVVINRTGKKVLAGEAQSRATRMSKRGRTLTVTAITDLQLRPNRPMQVSFQDVTWSGTLRAVTFRHPDGVMDLTIDIIES